MGVGTPINILENIALGVDMFDCVMPTRNARNGMLFTAHGSINIKNKKWENDFFLIKKYTAIKKEANSILYQTNGMASMDINFPKIAVKPHIKTIKWRCK